MLPFSDRTTAMRSPRVPVSLLCISWQSRCAPFPLQGVLVRQERSFGLGVHNRLPEDGGCGDVADNAEIGSGHFIFRGDQAGSAKLESPNPAAAPSAAVDLGAVLLLKHAVRLTPSPPTFLCGFTA